MCAVEIARAQTTLNGNIAVLIKIAIKTIVLIAILLE